MDGVKLNNQQIMARVHLAASYKHTRDDISLVFISIGMQGSNRGWPDEPLRAWIYETSNTQTGSDQNAWIAVHRFQIIMEGSACHERTRHSATTPLDN